MNNKLNKQYQNTLFQASKELNHFIPKESFVVNPKLIGFIMAQIDKELGRAGRLQFLMRIYGRKITTSKIGVEGGLLEHEAASLLRWAAPYKVNDKAWTVANVVKQTCTAFQVLYLYQETFLDRL